MPPAVKDAVNRLADSLRPNADEPAEAPSRVHMPAAPAPPKETALLAAPTVAVARGRTVSAPVARREFRRTDTVVFRAAVAGAPDTSARLLNPVGQPLADLPAVVAAGVCEVTVPLGSVGAGDYVLEMSAKTGDEAAGQFVAFRVLAR